MNSKTPLMATLVETYWQRPATPAEHTAMRGEVKRHFAKIGNLTNPRENRMFDVDPFQFERLMQDEAV